MIRIAIVTLGLVACAKQQTITKPLIQSAPVVADGSTVYDKLFVTGVWSLDGVFDISPGPDGGDAPQSTAVITCNVVAEKIPQGKHSTIACIAGQEDTPMLGMAPVGEFIATDAGLWFGFDGGKLDPDHLDPTTMLIAKTPVEHTTDHKEEKTPDALLRTYAKRDDEGGGVWCYGVVFVENGETAGWQMCSSVTKGLVRGSALSGEASVRYIKR